MFPLHAFRFVIYYQMAEQVVTYTVAGRWW